MTFIQELVSNLLNNPTIEVYAAATAAYATVLEPYHGFFARSAFQVSDLRIPYFSRERTDASLCLSVSVCTQVMPNKFDIADKSSQSHSVCSGRPNDLAVGPGGSTEAV